MSHFSVDAFAVNGLKRLLNERNVSFLKTIKRADLEALVTSNVPSDEMIATSKADLLSKYQTKYQPLSNSSEPKGKEHLSEETGSSNVPKTSATPKRVSTPQSKPKAKAKSKAKSKANNIKSSQREDETMLSDAVVEVQPTQTPMKRSSSSTPIEKTSQSKRRRIDEETADQVPPSQPGILENDDQNMDSNSIDGRLISPKMANDKKSMKVKGKIEKRKEDKIEQVKKQESDFEPVEPVEPVVSGAVSRHVSFKKDISMNPLRWGIKTIGETRPPPVKLSTHNIETLPKPTRMKEVPTAPIIIELRTQKKAGESRLFSGYDSSPET